MSTTSTLGLQIEEKDLASTELSAFRIQLFTATWLSYAGFYICRKVFGVLKAPLKEVLLVNDLQLSHLWTGYLIAYMLGQFMTSYMGRRVSGRALLLSGMGLTVLANLLIGSLVGTGQQAYMWILLIMIIHGFAQATGWASNVGLMANWTTRAERGTVMGIWGTCYQLGGVAGKAMAAFLYGWIGLAWSFWGSSLVFGFIWILFYFWGRENPESVGLALPQDTEETSKTSSAVNISNDKESSTRVWQMIISMGLIYFSFKFLRYALDSWSALILKEQFQLSTSSAGYLSSIFDWVGFLGVIVAGFLSDRVYKGQRLPLIFWMSVGSFVAAFLMWFIGGSSATMFVFLLGLIGFMLMGPDSLLSGAAAMDVGDRRMALTAAGVINGLGSLGPIVQEPAIGWVKTYWGMNSVYNLMLAVARIAVLSTAIFWYRLRRLEIKL